VRVDPSLTDGASVTPPVVLDAALLLASPVLLPRPSAALVRPGPAGGCFFLLLNRVHTHTAHRST